MKKKGIIVGCDVNQEGFLLWWWNHYSLHNSYPVVFADFGMSKKAICWCKEKGTYLPLSLPSKLASAQKKVSIEKKEAWEDLYGKGVLDVRAAWLKKPFAILQFPWDLGLWLDLDCEIRENLDPLFHSFNFGIDLALVRDRVQDFGVLLPGEVLYNSGLVAFRKNAKILHHWIKTILHSKDEFPGDQDALSRAIFMHKPSFLELSSVYNWPNAWGYQDKAVIHHFCGGSGKLAILEQMNKSERQFFISSTKNDFSKI
jgi:hypothetical protein